MVYSSIRNLFAQISRIRVWGVQSRNCGNQRGYFAFFFRQLSLLQRLITAPVKL